MKSTVVPKVKHKSKHGITVETTEGVCRFQVELVSQGKPSLLFRIQHQGNFLTMDIKFKAEQ